MSSYSNLASISSAIEKLELKDTFHDQDEEISIGAEAVCVEDPGIGANDDGVEVVCFVADVDDEKKRSENKDYEHAMSFDNLVQAMKEIEKGAVRGQLWTRQKTYDTKTTTKFTFSCRNFPRCPKRMQIHLDPSSTQVHCYVSSDGHDHVRNNNRFLDPESRAKAISLNITIW
jgi:hypothetical protein